MSLNWILKTDSLISDQGKVLILIPGEMIEYYIEKMFVERFGYPNTNFGLLHWQGHSLAYSILIFVLMIQTSLRPLEWGWIPKA